MVIPGVKERDADRAAHQSEQDQRAARQAAELSAKREAAAHRQKTLKEADAKAERERQQKVAAKRERKTVSTNAAAAVSMSAVLIACVVVYFVSIRLLRLELERAVQDLKQVQATVKNNATIANRNIDAIGKDLQALQRAHDSLVSTVNYNANVANTNNRRY